MAIFTVTSNAVENVDIFVDVDFKAGMALMRDDNGKVVKADNSLIFQKTLSQKIGKFLGFATSDHSSAANTIIVPDVIGSSYIDNSYNFIRTENNEVLTTKRALNDNLNESLNKPYNPSENMVISRRGLAVYNQPNNIFITDQFARVLHGDYGLDYTTQIDFNSGDLLTFGSGVNAGKLVKVNVNSIAQEILIVGVVEKFISSTNLLHFRQVFYSHPFSNDSAVMVLDAGNPYSFPNTGYIGTVCGITQNENQTMTLTAPAGHVFDKVLFASYGTPNGVCGSFSIGSCHAATSQSVVEGILLGNNSGTITQGGAFGDPCMGTNKRLYVQARFAPVQAKDLTVNNNNGTITNGVSYSTDGGGSWSFDGTNDYITIPRAGLVYGTGPKTLMAWARMTVNTGSWQIIMGYGNPGATSAFFIGVNELTTAGGGFGDDIISGTISLNTWFHLTLTYNSTVATLYLNGSSTISSAKNWNVALGIYDGAIGRQMNPQQYWNGNISDVRLYNRALSASEILAYYNYTKGRYGL
jgi:hypothetical protein